MGLPGEIDGHFLLKLPSISAYTILPACGYTSTCRIYENRQLFASEDDV
jgi:hypothetical protein